jgi:hypothetical protein
MGKGAGNLATWYTHLYAGVFLVEFKNLRLGRAFYYATQIKHKLPITAHFTNFYSKSIKIQGGSRSNPKHTLLM